MKQLRVLRNRKWLAGQVVGDPDYWLEELPNPVDPITVLQGKKMYEGDPLWVVWNDWSIQEGNMWYPDGSQPKNSFSSLELAEQYVRDNKPVYPVGIVHDFIALASSPMFDLKHCAEFIEKLKKFTASKND